ncbi:hypothetical protein [Paenibacillus crassostreae]|uniref:Uncharacterized protein n=1 Tax=Paenibacillus crassostreae TaxID=1763538 RepID=A0A167FTU6_9BACL|nr:hypothetical protein [Paenibacillus crassostreae]AOZ94070.1 hypothetical protein LPB68_19020 [Paenibacillus crassostreae]OAB76894.1 hypothetical protein PNBC_05720 [Paenibacillus crassostreae]
MKKKIVIKRKLRSLKIFRRSASASQVDYIFEASARRNPNFRNRCNCSIDFPCSSEDDGQSYMTIRNQTSKRIIVRLNALGREKWDRGTTFDERWNNFIIDDEFRLLNSGIIEPGANRGKYFRNFVRPAEGGRVGNNKGTLGLEVFDPRTNQRLYRALWYEQNWAVWGNKWLRCGHDYTFSFFEALIQAKYK